MGYWDIDWDIVVRDETPVDLRKPKRLAWLRVLVWPVKFIYNLLLQFRLNTIYYLTHSSQVCYMEAALNDVFDNDERRIYIADGPFKDPVPLYLDAEADKEVPLAEDSELPVSEYDAPVYLYTDAETAELGAQFIVYYPAVLALDAGQLIRMRALVDRYRLPSKHNYQLIAF